MEARIIQPSVLSDDCVLIGSESKSVCLKVSKNDDVWSVNEVWSSRDVKPDFNDFVLQEGFAFGFDGSVLCCIDLESGRRTWRQRGYGKGQLLLLPDEALLLVLSESGEVALVRQNPSRHDELVRFQAISGKTWNHPAIASGRLYVRNAREMACFELPTETPRTKLDHQR